RRVAWMYAPHQWVGAHRTALADLAALPPERVAIIRYEELTSRPEYVLGEIAGKCGVHWGDEERAAVLSRAAVELRPVESRWERLPRWKQRYVLSVIQELQEKLGYPADLRPRRSE